MGTPDRHARPTWLAPVRVESKGRTPEGKERVAQMMCQPGPNAGSALVINDGQELRSADLPDVASGGRPFGYEIYPSGCGRYTTGHYDVRTKVRCTESSACCSVCGKTHPALMDEYYFWIEESRYYNEQEQVAEWGAIADDPQTDWHRQERLPGLLHWESTLMVHLRWCRVHNGEFQQPRQSYEGVRITAGATPQLVFSGRSGDSLHFEITGGEAPMGYAPPPPPPGFRYDLATDEAITLPQVASRPLRLWSVAWQPIHSLLGSIPARHYCHLRYLARSSPWPAICARTAVLRRH